MGHIQRERLPKSKMASSDNDRFTFEIVQFHSGVSGLNIFFCITVCCPTKLILHVHVIEGDY